MEEEKLKELKERYGEIIVVETDKGQFVFKRPNRIAVKKFFDTVSRSVYDASYGLCIDLALLPSPSELMQMEEVNPGLVMILASEIQNFFYQASHITSRKL